MEMMQLIRPPPSPPPADGPPPHPLPRLNANGLQPVVRIKHPDYPPSTDVLISIPAADPLPSQPAQADEVEVSVGLHHETVLIICSIIANNAFDVYLSYDREGTRRVENDWGLESVLPAGEYWAQVPQSSSTSESVSSRHETQDPVSATPASAAGSGEARHQEEHRRQTPYPIVPNFENWRFPHGRLPALWAKDHDPPLPVPLQSTPTSISASASASTSTSTSIARRLRALQPIARSCAISAHRAGLEIAHLVHLRYKDWFVDNEMARYGYATASLPIDQPFNKIALRADLHTLFDSACLTIIPKPVHISLPSSSTSTTSSTTTSIPAQVSISTPSTNPASRPTRYALAVHVLDIPEAYLELIPLYHNQALCFQDIGNEFSRQYKSSREFLFARFAWSIFPLLRPFLERQRFIAIRVKGQQGNMSATAVSDSAGYEYKWESSSSLALRSRSISRKRSASQISQARNSAGYNAETDEELGSPLRRKRQRLSSAGVPQLDEDAEWLLDWATRRREAAAESDLLAQSSGDADAGVQDIPRGRRRRRSHRRYGEITNSSSSPRGSIPDLSVSVGSSSSAFPDYGYYEVGDDHGNSLSATDDVPTKNGLSSGGGDTVLREDVDSI